MSPEWVVLCRAAPPPPPPQGDTTTIKIMFLKNYAADHKAGLPLCWNQPLNYPLNDTELLFFAIAKERGKANKNNCLLFPFCCCFKGIPILVQ